MDSIEEYLRARARCDGARVHVQLTGSRLIRAGQRLQSPQAVCISGQYPWGLRCGGPSVLSADDIPTWEQLVGLLQTCHHLCAAVCALEAALTPEQRFQVQDGTHPPAAQR